MPKAPIVLTDEDSRTACARPGRRIDMLPATIGARNLSVRACASSILYCQHQEPQYAPGLCPCGENKFFDFGTLTCAISQRQQSFTQTRLPSKLSLTTPRTG